MKKSPSPPDPAAAEQRGAIPKTSNIPVKMDVDSVATKRKARKSDDDDSSPPASPSATKRKIATGGETPPKDDDVASFRIQLSLLLLDEAAAAPQARVRAYPNDFTGPFCVFFRSKGKPLNVCKFRVIWGGCTQP